MHSDPRRILVINVTRIGDTLFTTPVLAALHAAWPQAEITVLAHPTRGAVLAGLPEIHQLGSIDKRRARLKGWLPGKPYDLALVFGHDRPLLDYAFRVARQVVAYRQEDAALNSRLSAVADEPPPHGEHAVLRALRLTDVLGLARAGLRLRMNLSATERAWARAFLAQTGLSAAHPLLGLQVASFPTKAYRDWPIEHFATLCDAVRTRWPQAGFLIFGGQEERVRTHWLKTHLGAQAAMLAGQLSLRQTAAMMSLVDAYVGVDTGPTHIMGTFDIPIVGLYHCRLPRAIYGPLDHPLDFGLDHPRFGQACDETTPMAEISVEQVFSRLCAALEGGAP